MDNPRLMELITNVIEWGIEVSEDTTHDLLRGMGITSEELEEIGYEQENFPKMHEWVQE